MEWSRIPIEKEHKTVLYSILDRAGQGLWQLVSMHFKSGTADFAYSTKTGSEPFSRERI